MKKYTRSTAKGFTLVELIVVIVILSILATIAFLSFTSQSASARDSKRKTDISGIVSKINVFLAQKGNGSIMQVINAVPSRQLSPTPSVGGQISVLNTDYQAGKINYANLGISPTDFMDTNSIGAPTDYAIGVTTRQGVSYQMVSRLEVDEAGNTVSNAGYVMGNYVARKSSDLVSAATGTPSGTVTKILLPTDKAGFFKTGDVVTISGSTATGAVTVISNNGIISVDSINASFSGVLTNVLKLNGDESAGLVQSEKTSTGIAGQVNAPY